MLNCLQFAIRVGPRLRLRLSIQVVSFLVDKLDVVGLFRFLSRDPELNLVSLGWSLFLSL